MAATTTFFAVGTGVFPVDMLRVDSCWPDGSDDSTMLAASQLPAGHPGGLGHSRWRIRLRTLSPLNLSVKQWNAHGVAVVPSPRQG